MTCQKVSPLALAIRPAPAATTATATAAARGETFHRQLFAGGKPATPACGTCHSSDPRTEGDCLPRPCRARRL
ncbi:MAG: DUF1924 domain-containing protein [Candidatus Accumulibacter sp.]|nr:DUF1924 domain-containing protein [Candidatus Accumulibacter necessarius]